jgi:glycosyltransferase involved in cell wall biosynthesis
MISVLILTRNEEIDLPQCLASVAWCDDVHVFDSESTDRTREIAAAAGAHVTVRSFDGYASQRNAALTTLPFRHAWVFLLDADERPTPELAREMLAVTANPAETIGGFRMRRRDFFAGRWLAHAQLTPFYIRWTTTLSQRAWRTGWPGTIPTRRWKQNCWPMRATPTRRLH